MEFLNELCFFSLNNNQIMNQTTQNKKINIAIDGYSSTGKSSISKEIAKALNLIHLDTGKLYRGITVYAFHHCTEKEKINEAILIDSLSQIHLEFKNEGNELSLYLNGENIEQRIRLPKINEKVSFIAKIPEVRQFLLKTQQQIAKNGGVIMDGRDIGSVVLPDADYKFFLTASIQERTKRRFLELEQAGVSTTLEEVKKNLLERDYIDSHREIAPLKQDKDAILIDNSQLNKEETISLILSYIK